MQQILTLDNGGRPFAWATLEEAISLLRRDSIAWSLGEDLEFHGGISRITGTRSVLKVPPILAVKNQTFPGRVALTNSALFARDDNICCYCATRFTRSLLTREHVHPQSKGGPDSWRNCATACKPCNNRKGDLLLEECGMELAYLPYEPNTAEALILSGRHIIADQMEFLKACLPKDSRVLTRKQ